MQNICAHTCDAHMRGVKDPSFHCDDIRKTMLTFKNHQFSLYFAYFHSFAQPKSSKVDNYCGGVGPNLNQAEAIVELILNCPLNFSCWGMLVGIKNMKIKLL